MRKLKLFFACLLMAFLSIGQVWAVESNFTDKNLSVGEGELTWTASPAFSSFDTQNGRGPQSAKASTEITMTSAEITGTITSVVVTASTNGTSALSISIDGNAFGGDAQTITSGTAAKNSPYEFTGSATVSAKPVIVSITRTNCTVWIKSITVTYTAGGGGGSDPTLSLDPQSKEFETTGNSAQTIALTASNFSNAISSVTCAFYSEATCATSISRPDWVNEPIVNGTKTQVSVNVADNDGAARQTWMKITASDGSDEASAVFAISQKALVVDYATLPFAFDGGRADIATTSGMSQSGLDTDYGSSPKLKFKNTDTYVIIKIKDDQDPGTLTYDILGNSFSGSTFKVQQSADNVTYTDVAEYTTLGAKSSESMTLLQTTRYVKFVYTEKVNGNVALGNIAISEYSTPTACETPTFTPIAGSYEGAQSVTISCSTAGATIYYTTDGTNPKESATKSEYTSAINVSESKTIKAYAEKDGLLDSEIAEAAYTITTAADVFIDLTDGYWSFPTADATELTTFTNSETGYAVKCSAANGYKVSGSSYFIIGKQNSYIELPTFSNPIEKIVVVKGGGSSPSGSVVFNIFDGDDAASTAATGCTEDKEFVIENPEGGKTYTLKITSGHNLQLKGFKIYYGEEPTVAKPIISGAEKFVTSTSVSMTCSTTGAEIYYTLDSSDPQLGGATKYSAPFSLTEDATVNARAKLGDDWSGMVSKTFTKVTALATMAEVQAAAETTEKAINVSINNWVVTAVSGSQVWFADADNAKGILLYKSEHGFTAGKKLNGTVIDTKVKLFNLYPELTSLVASEVTVTDAEDISPRSVTIPTLTSNHPAEQGTIVKLSNVTYSNSDAALSDGVNLIAADNKLYSSLALVDGVTYDITGIVTYYKDGDDPVIKIAPRSATDVEPQSPVVIPTAANIAALKAAARGTYILTLTNAVVTYVNGKNAFIEDATAGALIFIEGHGYNAGDCLNGDYQVTTTDYIGNCEITVIEPQAGATKSTAEIPVTTLTITQLNADYPSYESRRIKIAGVDVTNAIGTSDRNGEISDATNTFAVYAGVANTITLTLGDNVDIIGYPGYNNEAKRLNVWEQSDITVNTKEDPGLAYDPEMQTITKGDAWTAPAFSNPHSLAVSFESDNESVASVNTSTGVITLGEGTGTAVITAHTDGDATYAAGDATYTITVNPYIPANTDILTAEKIGTTTYADWTQSGFGTTSVYKGNSTTGTGTNAGAIQLRYHATDVAKQAGIVLATSNGLYLRGLSVTVKSGSNTLNVYAKNTAYTNQLDLYSEDEDVRGKLIGTVSSTGAITLEEGVSYDDDYQYIGMRSTGGAIYLTDITVTWGAAITWEDVRPSLSAGRYYTICYPKAMTAIKGGTLWSFVGRDDDFAYIQQESAPFTAGKPYLIYATAEKLEAVLEGEDAAAAGNYNGLYGTLSYMSEADLTGKGADYLLKNNELHPIGTGAYLEAQRAYIIKNDIPEGAPAHAPGKNIRSMPMHKDATTGIDDLNASDAPRKMVIDGTMFILRGEKLYDATGRMVK